MYPRTNYEMTPADLENILDACKPVPMIMLQCGTPSSPQENANRAWAELGNRMGFDHMTVQPTGRGNRFFTAVPRETEEHKKERLAREAEEKRLQEIETLQAEITERQTRLEALSTSTPNDQALPQGGAKKGNDKLSKAMKPRMTTDSENGDTEQTLPPEPGAAVSRCCTCGYSWRTGRDGSHSCASVLELRIDTIAAGITAIAGDCDEFAKEPIASKGEQAWKSITAKLRALLPNE